MTPAGGDPIVLDTARRLFVAKGVAATGIEDLRATTGLSTGSLYHRFGSKEGLAAAVFVEAIASYQDHILDALRRHAGPEEGVKEVVRAHLAWHARETERARFLHDNGGLARSAAAGSLADRNQAVFGEFRRWWRTHAAYGALQDLEFDLSYVLWLGPAQELCRLWLANRLDMPLEAAADRLAEGAWNAVRGDRAPDRDR